LPLIGLRDVMCRVAAVLKRRSETQLCNHYIDGLREVTHLYSVIKHLTEQSRLVIRQVTVSEIIIAVLHRFRTDDMLACARLCNQLLP